MAAKKTYFPQRTFDDDLDALAQLGASSGWMFSGVDFEQLRQDAVEQRLERAKFDAVELEYSHVREEFGQAQEARYGRFADALNAARASVPASRRSDDRTQAKTPGCVERRVRAYLRSPGVGQDV